MKKLLLLAVLLAEIAGSAFSQISNGESDGVEAGGKTVGESVPAVITSVSASGLKRTKVQVAEKALRRFIGKDAASLDLDQVRACIIDTGILEPLSVDVLDDSGGKGKILSVQVREKWAIFPVPIFFADSSGIAAGGAFYDGNAFGMNHQMAIAGLYQTGGMVFTGFYMVPAADTGSFGWNLIFLYTQEKRRDSDERGNALRRFNTVSITAQSGLQYRFSETITAGFNFAYLGRMLRHTESPRLAPSSGENILRPGVEISARRSNWDGYLLSEENISLGYDFGWGLDSASFQSIRLRGTYEKSLLPGFRINSRIGALYSPDAPVLFETGPESAQINILPRSFSARNYAGLSLGLEKFLFRFPFGTLSLLGAWQMVQSQGPLFGSKNVFDYGVLGSMFFYLSRLAIPAVGIGAAYNIPAHFFQFSFMIGMTL